MQVQAATDASEFWGLQRAPCQDRQDAMLRLQAERPGAYYVWDLMPYHSVLSYMTRDGSVEHVEFGFDQIRGYVFLGIYGDKIITYQANVDRFSEFVSRVIGTHAYPAS